jgi:hypothetical protein
MKTCASDDLECYVVDNNGFVIISENKADTGKFFGEVDGTILESLVQVRAPTSPTPSTTRTATSPTPAATTATNQLQQQQQQQQQFSKMGFTFFMYYFSTPPDRDAPPYVGMLG